MGRCGNNGKACASLGFEKEASLWSKGALPVGRRHRALLLTLFLRGHGTGKKKNIP
ncbi:hypothetical protein MPNT_440011 [Candidatus Methylacidithermus pantelleriae]|uniref:Uncharacterized protein n=1 Tax=Candidatus Methylacidithermus pantelleriae TaxID=2744239 RepID=A0A8J2BUL9_9BACT|nr:hypothetical protein MPNT_440011 [Candidatus Methylacidithermus pantelleriae]